MTGASPAAPADGPFAARTARWLAAVTALSLAAAGLLAIFGDAFDVASIGSDSYSRSAIGHHAVVELWRALGHRVLVSRSRTAAKLGDGAVLVVAEPAVGEDRARAERLRGMLAESPAALLVLPKRVGAPDRLRPRWIGGQFLVPAAEAARVLRAAGVEGEVVRPASRPTFRGDLPAPALDAPQLVRSTSLTPLLSAADGILVGRAETDAGELLVLADPDVIATHGLGRGDNAVVAERLLERLSGDADRAVVIDETLHGHEQEPSIARELLRWPLAPATLQAALALALLAWAALVRFGRARREPPALLPGKAFLIENTAELLRHGGHGGAALAAYWRAAKEHVVRALRGPGAPGETADAALVRLAAARERGAQLAALERRVAALASRRGGPEIPRAALAIHAFREEMTHGADPHP